MADDIGAIGSRLRAHRTARGLTLEQLAARAHVSASTLSRLESGKRQVTLELLLPLTRELGIRIDDLLPHEVDDPRIRRPALRRGDHTLVPLSPEGASVETFRIIYPPRAAEGDPEPRVHAGFEWFYVLSGRIRLRLGDREHIIMRGEAVEFDTAIPHAVCSATAKPAHVISIFSAEGMRVHTRSMES